jgi:hypothetical protein
MIFTVPGWTAVLPFDAEINGGLNTLRRMSTQNAKSFDMRIPTQTDPVAPAGDNVMIGYSGGAALTRLERLKAATTEWTVAASEFYWKAYSDGGMPDAEFEAAVGLLGVAKTCATKHLNLLLEGQLECEAAFPCAFNEPGVTPPNTVVFGPVPEEMAVEQRAIVKRIQMMDLNPNTTIKLREERHEDGSVTLYTALVPKAAAIPAVNRIGKTDPSRGGDEGAEEVRYRVGDGAAPKPVIAIAAKTAIMDNGLTTIPNEEGFSTSMTCRRRMFRRLSQRSHAKRSGSSRRGERYEHHRETGNVLGTPGYRAALSRNRERSQDHRKHTTPSLVFSRSLRRRLQLDMGSVRYHNDGTCLQQKRAR